MYYQSSHPQTACQNALEPALGCSTAAEELAAPLTAAATPLLFFRAPRKQVNDVDGFLWDVSETRPTKHGFDLLFGVPAPGHSGVHTRRGLPRIVPTSALIAYWKTSCTDSHATFDLPASDSALRRMRQRLGFKEIPQRRDSWRNPIADLKKLPVCQFAEYYNVRVSVAIRWRASLLDRLKHPRRRSQDPTILAVLQSELSHQQAAEILGVTTVHARRLRRDLGLRREPKPRTAARPFPPKWKTPAAMAVLRSNLPGRLVAESLGISQTHALRLRCSLALLDDSATSAIAEPDKTISRDTMEP